MIALRALSKELGSPGALALYTAARKRGIVVTRQQVKELVSKRGENQIFTAVQPSAGKSVAETEYARFQADIIDQRNDGGVEGEEIAKDILVVVNVFTRKVYARAMPNKTAAETKKAMVSILATISEDPGVITTDGGAEFSGVFEAEIKKRGIALRLKDGKNSISVVDRTIQGLKMTLARMMASQKGSWQQLLGKAVDAINDTPKEVLHHESPAEVSTNPEVKFMLLQDNASKIRHNAELLNTRKDRLTSAGAMRAPMPNKSFKRGTEATYGGVKQLRDIEGSVAIAQDGSRIDVKHLKAVDENSTDVTARFGNKENSVRVAKQKKDVEVIVALTLAYMNGKERVNLETLRKFLKAQLRTATVNLEGILRKTKLTLGDALRLGTGIKITDGRWVST
jgi:hypothetical protein